MGTSSSKFRKHLQNGEEYAAMQLYQGNPEFRRSLDPNLSYGESHQHNTPLHLVAQHSMKSMLRIFLFELGGNPNKKNLKDQTSLHKLCHSTNADGDANSTASKYKALLSSSYWRNNGNQSIIGRLGKRTPVPTASELYQTRWVPKKVNTFSFSPVSTNF